VPIRLTQKEFAELVDQAVASLPEEFRPYMKNVAVDIHLSPARRLLESIRLPRSSTLLGIYHGVPMTKKSVTAPWDWPEGILIFQRNVEAVCDSREEIVEQVRKTVLHEVGHHFGLSEQDLRRLGYG